MNVSVQNIIDGVQELTLEKSKEMAIASRERAIKFSLEAFVENIKKYL